MRCPCALALVLVLLGLHASAQRGGGMRGGGGGHAPAAAGGGFGGAPHMASAPHFNGTFGRPVYATAPHAFRGSYGSYPASRYGPLARRIPYRAGLRAPGNMHRDRPPQPPPWRRYGPVIPPGFFASTFAYPGFFDFGFLDPAWDDPSYASYGGGAYAYPDPGYAYADPSTQDYPAEQPANDPYASQQAPDPWASEPQGYGYPSSTITLPAQPADENAVVLFFLDGRPPEQIRNFALTRTAILVTDGRMREIPWTDINVPLTARVNSALGIDFRPPGTN